MVTVKAYQTARVHTITVKNEDLFWVKIVDVQKGLDLKAMRNLIRKQVCSIYKTEDLSKVQKKNI